MGGFCEANNQKPESDSAVPVSITKGGPVIVVTELFCLILGLIGQTLFGVFVAKGVLRLNSPSMVPPQVADETRSNSIPLAELLGLGLLFGV